MQIHKDDIWKVVKAVCGMCVFMSTGILLPHMLVPYKEYIETIAFLYTAYQTYKMQPAKKETE